MKTRGWKAIDLLQRIVKWELEESFPNVLIALRILLTMYVSVATCERSFSKLKLIKTYLRSTMTQSRISNLAILSIERELANSIDFDNVINEFASLKARKIKMCFQ